MEEQIISFNTAKIAFDKGFHISQFHCYNDKGELQSHIGDCDWIKFGGKNLILAPTQSLLQKWLREVHNLDIFISPSIKTNHYDWLVWDSNLENKVAESDGYYTIYEEALEIGLYEALNLI